MQRLMSVLLVAVAACGDAAGDGANLLDAPQGGAADAGTSSDADAFQGLLVAWEAAPALPGSLNLNTMVTVTSAAFHVKKLEAISDGGAVPAATQNEFDVAWNAASQPFDLYFPSAPPAIYSKIRLGLDKSLANAPSIEITGTVQVDGSIEMFRVTSSRTADLEIGGYAVTLGLGESEGMPVIVKLDALLADVEWRALPTMNGVRVLDDTRTTAMDALFDRLEDAFTGPLD